MAKKQASFDMDALPTLNIHLLGRRITCITAPSMVDTIHQACIERRKITVAYYNVHAFNLSMQLPWFYEFMQTADISHCDGTGLLSAIRFMGVRLPIQYRVSYSVLLPQLLERCNQTNLSLFLLGAHPDNLQRAIDRVRSTYPNISVSGRDGYFSAQDPIENDAVIKQINQASPHILLVGMGMPLQESWIWQNRHRLTVNAILASGAAIDRLAGVVPDCPTWLSHAGLEWVYRLRREPRRLAARYLLGNPAFALQIMLAQLQVGPHEVLDIQPRGQFANAKQILMTGLR